MPLDEVRDKGRRTHGLPRHRRENNARRRRRSRNPKPPPISTAPHRARRPLLREGHNPHRIHPIPPVVRPPHGQETITSRRSAPASSGSPDSWAKRYADWTDGLGHDWAISRQRFFGVAIPVWYPIDGEGNVRYDDYIVATNDMLPVDPMLTTRTGLRRVPARQTQRLHRRARRLRHLVHLLANPADPRPLGRRRRPHGLALPGRPPTPSPRHHPHLGLSTPSSSPPSTTATSHGTKP